MRDMRFQKRGGRGPAAWLVCGLCAAALAVPQSRDSAGGGTSTQETWMGVYINGVKVGHSRTTEELVTRQGQEVTRITSESQIRVSRLGSDPIDLVTIQESWQDQQARPLEVRLVTKMSAAETVITFCVPNVPPPKFSYQATVSSPVDADSTSASPSPSRSVA